MGDLLTFAKLAPPLKLLRHAVSITRRYNALGADQVYRGKQGAIRLF